MARSPSAGCASVLFRISRGQMLAYVTDAADHPTNRAEISRLAGGADHLFIEAAFLRRDRALADATRHLTARAAGEIARAAGVRRVTPFHFRGATSRGRRKLRWNSATRSANRGKIRRVELAPESVRHEADVGIGPVGPGAPSP